jgi:hypothetical protein
MNKYEIELRAMALADKLKVEQQARFIHALQQTKQDLQEKYEALVVENERLRDDLSISDKAADIVERNLRELSAHVSQLQQWKDGVLAEVGPKPKQTMLGAEYDVLFITEQYAPWAKRRINHLAAQLSECKRDAERYQIIRQIGRFGLMSSHDDFRPFLGKNSPDELDDQVDAAISAQRGEQTQS